MGLNKTNLVRSRVSATFKDDVEKYADSIDESTSSLIRTLLKKELKNKTQWKAKNQKT